ncbi:hypothetical protein D3C87_1932260 [compost metagenome]
MRGLGIAVGVGLLRLLGAAERLAARPAMPAMHAVGAVRAVCAIGTQRHTRVPVQEA